MAGILPKQKISKSERTLEWYKENAIYRSEEANVWGIDKQEIFRLYRIASGQIDDSEYKYVLNPYNTATENITGLINYPAKLRNIDIITPIINALMGEKADRPFNHMAVVASPGIENQTKIELDKAFIQAISQKFINSANEVGFPTGVPTREVPELENIKANYNVNNSDSRAIVAQEIIDFLKYDLQLKDKYQEGYFDWLVSGRVYTYKTVYYDKIYHEIVPVLELSHGNTKTGFIEDADWVVRKTRFSLNSIIDRWRKKLKKEEIDFLENKVRNGGSGIFSSSDITGSNISIDKAANAKGDENTILTNGDLIEAEHIVWKGFEEVGILTYLNEVGQEMQMEVETSYKLNKAAGDISIEYEYRNRVFEVWRIAEEIYLDYRALPIERESLNNASEVKLPYNGRVGYNERGTVNSVVKQLLPSQGLYNIFHFRRELTLARNKDKITLFPIGMMPDEFTQDYEGMSKYLRFVESTSIAFIDEQKEGILNVLNAIKSIDLSLGNYVAGMTELLRSIKEEAWDAVGMNRQRYGSMNSSDGKAVTEAALARSFTITRELNRRFEKFEESDLQGLMDYSKFAWIDGFKGMYISSEGRLAFLEIDPVEHLHTDYAIYAVDSVEEANKLNQAKQYAFGWAQKSTVPAGVVIDILDSNNMSKLKSKVNKAEEIQRQYEEKTLQAQNQNAQMLQDKKDADAEKDRQKDITVAEIQAGASVGAASIRANSSQSSPEDNVEEEIQKVDKAYQDYIDKLRKQDSSKQKEGLDKVNDIAKRRLDEAKLALSKKKMENDLAIAKANKNKYDK